MSCFYERLIFSNCLHSAYNSLPKFFALYVAFHNCGTVCSSILWNWIFTNNSGALNSLLRGQDIEQWIIIYSSAYTCCFFLCRIWQSHINLHEFWACESVWFLSCFVQYWPLLRSFWILHVCLMLPLLLWLCPLENSLLSFGAFYHVHFTSCIDNLEHASNANWCRYDDASAIFWDVVR